MGILDALRGGLVAGLPEQDRLDLAEELDRERATTELLTEAVAELELALDDQGWTRLAAQGDLEFTRDGLRKLTALCQLMAIKNPLIKRGCGLRFYYVWGEGVQISARATGQDASNPGEQDVNAVVQDFLDEESTTAVLSGPSGHASLERCLAVDGNVFVALFTSPLTGKVTPRLIPLTEIVDVLTNPDDRDEPWFYKRRSIITTIDPATGKIRTRDVISYHPAVGYWPATRPKKIDDADVLWDAPILHAWTEDKPLGWKFGIPDAYAAIDWARAYKTFLEDWATLIKALSRFAWRATAPGAKQAKVRKALAAAAAVDPVTGANQIGAAVMTPDINLEAIPKSGATIDSESGRPIAAMVAAALDVPVTMLLGDPGTTGARATAETLDRPTELMAATRRALWTGVWKRILRHVIEQAVIAPRGPLRGVVTRDGDRLIVTLAGDTNPTVDVDWPDLDEDVAVDVLVKAITLADQTEKLPPLVIARLLLQALGVAEPDEILEELTDDNGQFIDPSVTAGQVAVDAFNDGRDPAAVAGDTSAE